MTIDLSCALASKTVINIIRVLKQSKDQGPESSNRAPYQANLLEEKRINLSDASTFCSTTWDLASPARSSSERSSRRRLIPKAAAKLRQRKLAILDKAVSKIVTKSKTNKRLLLLGLVLLLSLNICGNIMPNVEGTSTPFISSIKLNVASSTAIYDNFDDGSWDSTYATLYHYNYTGQHWFIDTGREENGYWNLTTADYPTDNVTMSDFASLYTKEKLNAEGKDIIVRVRWNTATTWHDFNIYITNETGSLEAPVPILTYWQFVLGHSHGTQYGIYDYGVENGNEFRNREVLFFNAENGENIIELKISVPTALSALSRNITFSYRLNIDDWVQVDSWAYTLDFFDNYIDILAGTMIEPSWYAVDWASFGIDKTETITDEEITEDKITFAVHSPWVAASSGTTSITKVYSGNKGQPTQVYGATSWSFNSTSRIVTITRTFSNLAFLSVSWGDTGGESHRDHTRRHSTSLSY